MNAITYINQNLDVEKLLRHYDFQNISVSDDLIRSCCKLHGGNNPTAFVINKNNGLWFCHTGDCGGGDIFTLIERLEGFSKQDFPKTVRWVASFFGLNIDGLSIQKHSDYLKELRKFISVVKNSRNKYLTVFTLKENIKQVTKYNNFLPETLEFFNLGYVLS